MMGYLNPNSRLVPTLTSGRVSPGRACGGGGALEDGGSMASGEGVKKLIIILMLLRASWCSLNYKVL